MRYRQFPFGYIDPFQRKALISSAENNAHIACAQLIELTFRYN